MQTLPRPDGLSELVSNGQSLAGVGWLKESMQHRKQSNAQLKESMQHRKQSDAQLKESMQHRKQSDAQLARTPHRGSD